MFATCQPHGVENNNPMVSSGGKLVLELIAGGEYFLVNSSENVMEDPSQEKNPTIQPLGLVWTLLYRVFQKE